MREDERGTDGEEGERVMDAYGSMVRWFDGSMGGWSDR